MTRLDFADYLLRIRAESDRFAAVLADVDPTARVPACPDWDADDLLWHLTEVQWFWATVVAGRPDGPPDDDARPERPGDHRGLLELFATCSTRLTDALAAADPAETAWSWADEQTVGFTFRRQAHEALIHRLDAEQAAGDVTPLDAGLAADGVAEALEVMYGGEAPPWGRIEPGPHHVRVELTDTGTTLWTNPCTFYGTDPDSGKNYDGPHVLVVDDPGVEASAVVTGTAADVDAWLWKRVGPEVLDVSGDDEAHGAFLAAVSPPLD